MRVELSGEVEGKDGSEWDESEPTLIIFKPPWLWV